MVAHGVLADSRTALDDNTRSDAAAVHEFRKSMKRWRALLRLLEPYIGEPGRKLRSDARDLARELAVPRDAQSALDGLNDALKHDTRFSKRSLLAIRDRIEKLREQAEGRSLNSEMRARMIGYLRRALRATDRWLLAPLGPDDVAERAECSRKTGRLRAPTICMNCAGA